MDARLFEDIWVDHQPDNNDAAAFWSRRASSFNAHSTRQDSQEHRNRLVAALARRAGLNADSRVLDIGCGPGRHSLLFARRAGMVEGFDIAPGMIECARQNAAEAGLDNVRFQVLDWASADLDQLGWRKKFQLVMGSKTPAVNNRATLEKMMAASCGYCCLITHVDTVNSIREALKPLVDWDEKKARISRSFYCAFNLLWLMGYYPEVEYMDRQWESDWDLEEAAPMFVRHFESVVPVSAAQKDALARRLEELSRDGKIHERVASRVAVVFWAV